MELELASSLGMIAPVEQFYDRTREDFDFHLVIALDVNLDVSGRTF